MQRNMLGPHILCYDLDHPQANELIGREDTKIVHLLRHGEAMHQVHAREEEMKGNVCLCFAAPEKRGNLPNNCPYQGPKALVDPALSETGRSAVIGIGETDAQIVYVSPTKRSLETGLIVFNRGAERIPVVALEQLRPRIGVHMHNKRLPISTLRASFPTVDFSQVESDEDTMWAIEYEPRSSLDQRASFLLQTIFGRPETSIAVVTHVTMLLAWFFPANDTSVLGHNPDRVGDDTAFLDYVGGIEGDHLNHVLEPGHMHSSIWVPQTSMSTQ